MSPLLLSLALLAPTADPDVPELAAQLRRAAAVRPHDHDLRWQQIPWLTEPADALKQSKAENRPMLVWLAGGRGHDGTPLERC